MGQTEAFQTEDENFYKAVDKKSVKLRATANDLATFLSSIKNPPAEITALIQTAKNIKTMDIHALDKVILDLKDAISVVNTRLSDKKFIATIPPYKMAGMTQKENALVIAAFNLMKAADKLMIKSEVK